MPQRMVAPLISLVIQNPCLPPDCSCRNIGIFIPSVARCYAFEPTFGIALPVYCYARLSWHWLWGCGLPRLPVRVNATVVCLLIVIGVIGVIGGGIHPLLSADPLLSCTFVTICMQGRDCRGEPILVGKSVGKHPETSSRHAGHVQHPATFRHWHATPLHA